VPFPQPSALGGACGGVWSSRVRPAAPRVARLRPFHRRQRAGPCGIAARRPAAPRVARVRPFHRRERVRAEACGVCAQGPAPRGAHQSGRDTGKGEATSALALRNSAFSRNGQASN